MWYIVDDNALWIDVWNWSDCRLNWKLQQQAFDLIEFLFNFSSVWIISLSSLWEFECYVIKVVHGMKEICIIDVSFVIDIIQCGQRCIVNRCLKWISLSFQLQIGVASVDRCVARFVFEVA